MKPYLLIIVILFGLLVGVGIALAWSRRSSVEGSGQGLAEADRKPHKDALDRAGG